MAELVNKIPLGSGDIYMAVFTDAVPADETLEVPANMLGEISGGAYLEYKNEFFTAESDNGKKKKTVLTKEEVKLKTGVCTVNKETFARLTPTARTTEDTVKGKRTTKIGGLSKDDGKYYVIRFIQHDPVDGDLRVTIIGKNVAGLTMSYQKKKESILNPEFLAEPLDAEGTLVIIEEDIPKVGALNVE